MPLKHHIYLDPEGEIGIWETTESIDLLVDQLVLTEEEKILVENMKESRKKEWVSSRFLVHTLSGRERRGLCLKDEFGKPYLEDSDYHISISHSEDYTAVIASPYHVGIDIQKIVEKMDRIARKFVSDKEWEYISKEKRLEHLHIVWGAKEAMYKAWGKKGIDFRGHLFTPVFEWDGKWTKFQSYLTKANITMIFDVIAEKIDDYILVYAIEKARYV